MAYDADTTCKGLNDSVIVVNSQAGVSYQAYVNGNSIGTAVLGTGGDINILLPYTGGLDAYAAGAQPVTISVKASAGSCASGVQLNQTVHLVINTNVDLTNETAKVDLISNYGTMEMCPSNNLQVPIQVNGVTGIPPFYLTASYTQFTPGDSLTKVPMVPRQVWIIQ